MNVPPLFHRFWFWIVHTVLVQVSGRPNPFLWRKHRRGALASLEEEIVDSPSWVRGLLMSFPTDLFSWCRKSTRNYSIWSGPSWRSSQFCSPSGNRSLPPLLADAKINTCYFGERGGWSWMGWWCGRVHRIALHPHWLLSSPAHRVTWGGNPTAPPWDLACGSNGTRGRDLSYPIPWDISIRSDKEGQSVYGPSLAPMEEKVDVPGIFGGTETVQVTALGRSKAAHEFLVLHYFGLDSAKHWDVLTSEVLPAVQLPGAQPRRATALEMFGASHITPSHRRMPHVLWTDSMTLIWNLLMGGRMGRYTGSPDTLVFDQRIDVRRFSAGSFAGLSALHLLWKIPNVVTNGKLGAIACPPQLIVTPPTDHTLHLLHYEADQLCVWKPGEHQLDQLQIRYTYVSTEGPAYKEHFGAKERNYSHWLSLNHTAGWWDLARFLFVNPEAASSAKRDATPLRLLSWLSFRLEPAVDELDSDLLALGTTHLEMDTPFVSAEALRDHLIELISVRNLRHRPEALFALFRQFLQRLTLPRICHFLDLVLPQLTPVRAPWADATRTLWTCHHIRASSHDHVRMDIRFSQGLQLLISLRRMTISTTCGFSGAPCRSSCFRIHEWCIRGCQSVSRPSGTSIASTAYPIRLEERHGSACVLPSPEWTPCERSFPGCPHRTRVCCDSGKENWKQALETGCPFRDWVCLASTRHCMGLLQWCPTQAKRNPISGLPWSAHGAAGTCFPGEHFHCGYGVPRWHKKCWRARCFHQHGPRKAVSRVWAPSGREVHTHLSRWTGTIVCCFSEVTSICPACF